MSVCASMPIACRCFTAMAAVPSIPPCSREAPMAEIRLESVTKKFADVTAVENVDLTVHDGEFVVLLGPTGAGKTTTLRLIAGLEKPEEGRIFINGRDAAPLSPAERDV